jgi:hypothetical protein
MIALVLVLVALLTLDAAAWRWGADSRRTDQCDRYWWPHG